MFICLNIWGKHVSFWSCRVRFVVYQHNKINNVRAVIENKALIQFDMTLCYNLAGLGGHCYYCHCLCVRLSGAKEWMILNPRGIHFDSERWGIWVSTSKTTYSRCGVRLKCCGEPQGLIEHIELRFSGLSRCSEDSQAVISGPLLPLWLLIPLTKSIRLLFNGIFLPLNVFVYPCTMVLWALTHMGTIYAVAEFNLVICQGQ